MCALRVIGVELDAAIVRAGFMCGFVLCNHKQQSMTSKRNGERERDSNNDSIDFCELNQSF